MMSRLQSYNMIFREHVRSLPLLANQYEGIFIFVAISVCLRVWPSPCVSPMMTAANPGNTRDSTQLPTLLGTASRNNRYLDTTHGRLTNIQPLAARSWGRLGFDFR